MKTGLKNFASIIEFCLKSRNLTGFQNLLGLLSMCYELAKNNKLLFITDLINIPLQLSDFLLPGKV